MCKCTDLERKKWILQTKMNFTTKNVFYNCKYIVQLPTYTKTTNKFYNNKWIFKVEMNFSIANISYNYKHTLNLQTNVTTTTARNIQLRCYLTSDTWRVRKETYISIQGDGQLTCPDRDNIVFEHIN